jgi:signal transduction histidine kinase
VDDTSHRFTAFLSHELHNNLGCVLLSLKLLQLEFGDGVVDPPAVRRSLEDAQRVVQNTVTGMRKFLHFERVRKAGSSPELQAVDLYDVAARVARQFEPAAQGRGLTLVNRVEPGSFVASSPEMIALVLQNLVGNAVKYSSGGTIRIAGRRCGSSASPKWELSVTDPGPGIAADQLARIFEAFCRGPSPSGAGVGLGLAISAQAARLVGAELGVESRVGGGSTFCLRLPLSIAAAVDRDVTGDHTPREG